MMINVLYDTTFATIPGYSGIPQDTRLLLKTLALTPGVEVDALLHPIHYDRKRAPRAVTQLDIAHSLWNPHLHKERPKPTGFKKLARKLINALGGSGRETYALGTADNELLFDAIWRNRLEKSLLPSDRKLMRSLRYQYSPISEYELLKPGGKKNFAWRKLDTTGYDFLLFQDTRIVSASPGTIKLIRYHDPLPITAPDCFEDDQHMIRHYRLIEQAKNDCFFVCNSAVTQDELIRLFPNLEDRSFVIPYTLPDLRKNSIGDIPVSSIMENRRSFVSTGEIEAKPELPKTNRYIVMVSTLEPRKNFPGAIEAFDRYVSKHSDDDLHFVIVGRPGWAYKGILSAMSNGVRSGRIIHLVDLTFPELANIYRNAKALVFPSFGEGFGFTPMEALQFGTPGIVSDLPVHRWVMQDSVLYADPYNPDALVAQLERLLLDDGSDNLRHTLVENGRRVLDRYSISTTSTKWQEMFEYLLKLPEAASYQARYKAEREAFKRSARASDSAA